MLRSILVFCLLVVVKVLSHLFYRHRREWVGTPPPDKWKNVRVIAVLNHTSLYEPLLAGYAPFSLLWQVARHGVLPVAEKTMRRAVGVIFSFLMRHVVVVTRQRDHTWQQVLDHVDSKALVTILPEGRMKRPDGLDSNGHPMTVRGGIADILEAIPDGRMIVVYSGGLHHIQAPGEILPRPFRRIHSRIEFVDIRAYREDLKAAVGEAAFKKAVIQDLEQRRNTHCPARPMPPTRPLQVEGSHPAAGSGG